MNVAQGFYFVLVCFVLLCACSPRQELVQREGINEAYREKYQNQLEPGAKLIKAFYHYTIEKVGDNYVYKEYFPDTRQITAFRTYSDKSLSIKSGPVTNWWDDGSLRSEGQYAEDQKTGDWTYYIYGTKSDFVNQGVYVNGQKSGAWTSYDMLGQIVTVYHYNNGELNGPYQRFHNSILQEEGVYTDGEITSDTIYHNNFVDENGKVADTMPYMASCDKLQGKERTSCSQTTLLQAIYRNIKYPALAREMGIQGTAVINFIIEKDGSLNEVEVKRGLCKEIQEECLKTLESLPTWKPGTISDEPVRVEFRLPIKFKLE